MTFILKRRRNVMVLYNAASTSMQRHDVYTTTMQRRYNVTAFIKRRIYVDATSYVAFRSM